MAKRRPKTVDEMEIQGIKDHLSRQDKTLLEAKENHQRLYNLIAEINTILGGSASLGVPGIRQDVKDLKTDVHNLKQSDAKRGLWVINLSSLPGAIVTLIMVIGGVLGIISTGRELMKKPPPQKQQQQIDSLQNKRSSFVNYHE